MNPRHRRPSSRPRWLSCSHRRRRCGVAMTDPAARVRGALLDPESLVRAVAAGRRRGAAAPTWRRAELRHVDLKAAGSR
ncbi:MAG: hypothetical protein R2734_02815 [Nocardioides sp.]